MTMVSATVVGSEDDSGGVDKIFISLFSSLSDTANNNNMLSIATNMQLQLLEDKLDGPSGVIHYLLPRLWQSKADNDSDAIQGDDALTVLSHLVETQQGEYMALTAAAVRQYIEHKKFNKMVGDTDEPNKEISDALILALSKLLIGPNSDNQVGIASDTAASLLGICKVDVNQNNRCGSVAKRLLTTLDTLWYHLIHHGNRESSISQMRIAALMIDICLLGGEEMSLALSIGIVDKLLHIALDHPNDDPLLQVSALDQLERLAVHNVTYPLTTSRADFLLGNDVLLTGLLILVGSPANDDTQMSDSDIWGEQDPINGGAALRLLTEICNVGILSAASISEETRVSFHLLLSSFRRALHNFYPQGELERLSYIYAVSSLVGSCAVTSSSSTSLVTDNENNMATMILSDTTLLNEWLSLHTRVSQPKLKATVLTSLSQVIEPSMWQDESKSLELSGPNDSTVLQLYQAFSRANDQRDTTELILSSAKSPFIEERLGAYNILKSLVMRGVIVRLLLLYDDGTGNGSSFLEWLLNPDAESITDGKKAKYEIVKALLDSNIDILGGLISTRAFRQLQEWKRNGPNFMATQSLEMATE